MLSAILLLIGVAIVVLFMTGPTLWQDYKANRQETASSKISPEKV